MPQVVELVRILKGPVNSWVSWRALRDDSAPAPSSGKAARDHQAGFAGGDDGLRPVTQRELAQ
jgi:hypothetical protein